MYAGDLGVGDYDVVILGGGKTEAEAAKVAAEFSRKVFLLRVLGGSFGGWPQTVHSKDVAGLKPGFELSVLGFCRHSEHDVRSRRELLEQVRKLVPGAYTRKVRGAHGDSCPPSTLFSAPSPEEQKLRSALERDPKNPEGLYLYADFLAGPEEVRLAEAQKVLETLLELAPKHELGLALARKLMVLITD